MSRVSGTTPILLTLALVLGGCGDDAAAPTAEPSAQPGTPTATATATALPPTPTPTATATALPTPTATATQAPTPTAIPGPSIKSQYRTNTWIISEQAGLDLDGDGNVDNGFIPVYNLSIDIIAEAVHIASYEALIAGEATPEQAENTAQSIEEGFRNFFSIENFNELLQRAIDSNNLNFIETFNGEPEQAILEWYSAVSIGDSNFALRNPLGTQAGSVSAGEAYVGPGTLTYDFSSIYDGPVIQALLQLDGEAILEVNQSFSAFTYAPLNLDAGDIGGIVWQDDMLSFVRGLVPTGICDPDDDPVEDPDDCVNFDIVEQTLIDLETSFKAPENAHLWTVSGEGGEVGVPVGFSWTAVDVKIVEQPGGGARQGE